MSHQIKDLQIENYKGILELKLENLSKVNILIGANNTKKTTILEAICIGKSHNNAFSGIGVANSRDLTIHSENLKSMFYNLDTKKQIKIGIETIENRYDVIYSDYKEIPSQDNLFPKSEFLFTTQKNGEEIASSRIGISRNGELFEEKIIKSSDNEPVTVDYVSSRSKKDEIMVGKLNRVKLSKNKKNIIKILKQMDSNILDVEEVNGSIYLDIEGIKELLPLKLMGDGIYNLLDIALTIALDNKIILIDEIENGMHYYALKELLKELLNRADKNEYQLVITTHSMDTLNAIRDILKFSIKELDISLVNLKNRDGKLESKVYDRRNFLEKMSEGWEIR